MSGIVCCFTNEDFSPENFDSVLNKSLIGRQTVIEQTYVSNIYLGLVSTPNSSASSASCDKSAITVYVDGYFVDAFKTKQTSAEWFLNKYSNEGEDCFGRLNGSFNILILNKQTHEITVITDRYGTRPLFYCPRSKGFSIAFRAELLVMFGDIDKQLNYNMIANMLSFSRIWFNDETFYEGIHLLPSQSVIQWSQQAGLSTKKYETIPLYKDIEPSVDGLVSVFKDIMSDFSTIPNLGLSLSGGLDSRVLLASGFKGPTFTWGYRKENDEIVLAENCADATANKWHFVKVEPESFLDRDGIGDELREGLDLFVQSYALNCYPQVVDKGVDGLITGLALDATMAGSYHPKDCNDLSVEETIAFAFSKIEYFDHSKRDKLITSEDIRSRIKEIEASIKKRLHIKSKQESTTKALQHFFSESRVRRWIFHRQLWQRAYCEDYIPTFDNRLIDYLSLFSLEERTNHKLFKQVLALLSPELNQIPYQGTNLPPSAPLKFWEEGEKLEAQKEQLARNVFYETQGDVFVPYYRYYSNFDEWFRTNSDWQKTTELLLFSDDTQITKFIDRSYIDMMYSEQKSGKKTHFGRLVILMSLEKTLRTFS